MKPADLYRPLDTVLDRSLVLGYSSLGYALRSRLGGWDTAPGSLAGRSVAVTGATGGIGRATCAAALERGARVHLIVRDTERAEEIAAELAGGSGGARERIGVHRCDVADAEDVRRFAAEWTGGPLDVLVHNAGAMPPERTESPQGHELTMALHVLGPVLMTDLLLPHLAPDARVVLVTSGGMYAQRLRADDPEYRDGDYSPTTAYARSKRAQVELLPHLQERWGPQRRVYATHPGWVGTAGVTESIPTFGKVMGPILRTPEQGADTTVWLAAEQPAPAGATLWHDRRDRPTHLLSRTRVEAGEVQRFAAWVDARVAEQTLG